MDEKAIDGGPIDVGMMEDSDLFTVPVIQFLMPHGDRRNTSTRLPLRCKELFVAMENARCRFEAEMLTTGAISVTISDPKEEEDLDISLTQNGPDVQAGMIAMLERRKWENRDAC